MTTERRTILTVGLGRYLAADPSSQILFGDVEKVKQMVATAHESVRQAGFDSESIDLNPHEHDESLKRLAERLRDGNYDAVLVGFGIRGNKDMTPLFEGIVQTWHEVAPRTKVMFGNTPMDVVATLQRNFPEVG